MFNIHACDGEYLVKVHFYNSALTNYMLNLLWSPYTDIF